MRNLLRVLSTAALSAYMLLVVTLFACQRALLYPRPDPVPVEAVPGGVVTTVAIPGGTVKMWWRTLPDAPLVLYFHGNAAQLSGSVATGRHAAEAGLGFAAVEYPGYGESTGPGPSEDGILDAGRAAIRELDAQGLGAPVCLGHSLGSGVAAAMAAEGRCSRLVLLSPFTSVAAMAAAQYPFVPVRWLVLDRFDSLLRAPAIEVPTLVIHGRKDDVIPYAMGEEMAAAIAGARFVARDRRHNDILDDETWAEIAAFVTER